MISQPESETDFSEREEVEEGILDDSELDAWVLRVTGNNDRNASVCGEPSTSSQGDSTGANKGDVISLNSDSVYSDFTSKLSAGCLCSGNCLSVYC